MKQVKKLFLTLCLSVLTMSSIMAQDLAQATELFNSGATALTSDDKNNALKYFKQALEMANSLGEDGLDIANESKAIIPKIYLQIGKDAVATKNFTLALTNIDLASKTATEYAVTEINEEISELIPQVLMGNANDLLNSAKFPEAIAEYKKVIEKDPENGVAYLRLGMALGKTKDEVATIAAYEKAATLGQEKNANNQLGSLFLRKANALYRAKKVAEAYTNAQKAVTYLPNHATANKLFGSISLASKKYSDAIAGFEKYLSVSPKAKDKNGIMYQLAMAYEAEGNKDKACGYYKQIVSDPKFKEFAEHKIKTELKCN